MKVYIVYNQSERYDSAYYDIVDMFDSKEKALTCIRTSADDFVKACDDGEPEGFDEYNIKYNSGDITIEDSKNPEFYECWFYEEHVVH